MQDKKIRGQKRRLSAILRDIDKYVPSWDNTHEYEHFHVPCEWWISSPKTYGWVTTDFSKKLLEKTSEIIKSKPDNIGFCKVVAGIIEPCFWNSQITIFYDENYFNSFFVRNDPYQMWIPLDEKKSFVKRRNIDCNLHEKGYLEILEDEDYTFKCQIWFYGELD